MEPEIVFVPSAFKHGQTREDILHAFKTQIHDGLLDGSDTIFVSIGFNRAGNPIEVFFNPVGDDVIKVFHAMPYRDTVLAQLRQ